MTKDTEKKCWLCEQPIEGNHAISFKLTWEERKKTIDAVVIFGLLDNKTGIMDPVDICGRCARQFTIAYSKHMIDQIGD